MNKKREEVKPVLSLFARYALLIILGISLPLFYKPLLPLTLWPVYALLCIFYNVSVAGNIILITGAKIEIAEACVAISAYYLLLILNLATSMKPKQRIYSLLFSFLSLLIINILRIFFFSVLYLENFAFFDLTHKFFWYVLSIGLVIGIWFLAVWLFKIKNVPAYSDAKTLTQLAKNSRN